MSEKIVPDENFDGNCGNMIIEKDNNLNSQVINQDNIQNINPQLLIASNSTNSSIYPSTKKSKFKYKNNTKLKGDTQNAIKCKIKNILPLKNSLKAHKHKKKLEIDYSKKLSINKKINQSFTSVNKSIKENTNDEKDYSNFEKFEESHEKNMFIENNDINIINNNIMKDSIISHEINFQYINTKNNLKNIIKQPLTSMEYKDFNSILPPYEYINEIWESFIEKEKFNNYSFNDIISIQTDINNSMRAVLIDWIISLQNKFYYKRSTLFLTINLIDRYITKKPILRTKFQLLGVASLFIAFKYEEIIMKNINDFVNLAANAFDKSEILEMEKVIIDLVEFNLDLPLSNDFFDLLSTVYKFDKKEYIFGCFLLEAFLLDISCCEYKQSQIALATCFIVLGLRKMKNINLIEGNNFIKHYSNEYKINFDIWRKYDHISDRTKKIYEYYEESEKVVYKDVYKIFDYIFF